MHTGMRPGSNDDGETLIELIIAMAIMGIAVVAIVGGIATSILMSDIHRKETTAGAYVRDYAEAVQGSYALCVGSTAPNYASTLAAQPSGFSPPTATVKFWDGTSFSRSACPATDLGLQQVTLTLSSTDSRASESIVVVVRKP
jgi:type II secretory pathway pseudopilin PulG